jgi:hypothetical protein
MKETGVAVSATRGRSPRVARIARLAGAILGVAMFATAVIAQPAWAYRSNNSRWTDYNYNSWGNGYVTATSNNFIRGTSFLAYCNRMSFSGATQLSAPGSNATSLNDYFSVGTPGGVSVSFPAGVSVGGGSKSVSWSTQQGGSTQRHDYSGYPITFTTGTWFYSVNHSVSSARLVGNTWYNGPSFTRYEWVC